MARVLVADDDPLHCMMMERMLAPIGLDVETHFDGDAALGAIMSSAPPHVAVLDWNMPGLDGIELCRQAKRGEKTVRTHLLMLTGRDDREDIVAALEAGADDYLAKPAHKNELRARILN